jgi:hypothetical protein
LDSAIEGAIVGPNTNGIEDSETIADTAVIEPQESTEGVRDMSIGMKEAEFIQAVYQGGRHKSTTLPRYTTCSCLYCISYYQVKKTGISFVNQRRFHVIRYYSVKNGLIATLTSTVTTYLRSFKIVQETEFDQATCLLSHEFSPIGSNDQAKPSLMYMRIKTIEIDIYINLKQLCHWRRRQ